MKRAYKLPPGFPNGAQTLGMNGTKMTVSLVPDGDDHLIQYMAQTWNPEHESGGPSLWAYIGKSTWIRIRESRQQVWTQASLIPRGATLSLHEWTAARERAPTRIDTTGLQTPKPDESSVLTGLPSGGITKLDPDTKLRVVAAEEGTGPLSFIESIQEIPVRDDSVDPSQLPVAAFPRWRKPVIHAILNGKGDLTLAAEPPVGNKRPESDITPRFSASMMHPHYGNLLPEVHKLVTLGAVLGFNIEIHNLEQKDDEL